MAAIFRESFDWTTTVADLTKKGWMVTAGSGSVGSTKGRFAGSNGFGSSGASSYILRTYANQTGTTTKGAAFRFDTINASYASDIMSVLDSTTQQLCLCLTPTGQLRVVLGAYNGTVLGTCTGTYVAGAWYYIELQTKIHATTGTVDVQVNGVNVLHLTNQVTKTTSNARENGLCLGPIGSYGHTTSIDDVYINDDTGGVHDTFEGDVRIITTLPSGAGSSAEWTPLSGANYAACDDPALDNDTTYVFAATAALIDTYAMGDLTATPTIKDVSLNIIARKDDAGLNQIKVETNQDATERDGATTFTLSSSYLNCQEIFALCPDGTAWDATKFNALQVGVIRSA